jgi:hypothetical protein
MIENEEDTIGDSDEDTIDDGDDGCEETDTTEVFKPEEWEKIQNNESDPFSDISEKEKDNEKIARPLEETLRRYCEYNLEYGLTYRDLTHIRNFKRHKGQRVPDFVIYELAVLEAKNWSCEKYMFAMKEANSQVLRRFKLYSRDLRRILIIGRPRWLKGVKEYLESKGVYIIVIGFVVTDENKDRAYNIIKDELDQLLYLPYLLCQPRDVWSI